MTNFLGGKNSVTYQRYIEDFSLRTAHTFNYRDNYYDIAANGFIDAFADLLFYSRVTKLSPFDLLGVIKKITSGEIDTYRKTQVMVAGRDGITPSDPARIIPELYVLFDNYHNIWHYIDNPFLREAMLHIKLYKIRPFEDGNKRLVRIITSYNLMKDGLAPFTISLDERKEYLKYIEQEDYDGLAHYFEAKSKHEEDYITATFNDDFKL